MHRLIIRNNRGFTIIEFMIQYEGEGTIPGIVGLGGCNTGSNCNISGLAAGNIDNESMNDDTWWISTMDATRIIAVCGNSETQSVAGEPYLSYNDEVCGF
jgi:type IV pilus assembly protein PilA